MKCLCAIALMGLVLVSVFNEAGGQADTGTADREKVLGVSVGWTHTVAQDQLLSRMAYRADSPSLIISFDTRGKTTEHSLTLRGEFYQQMTNRLTQNTALGAYGTLRYDFSRAVASWLGKGRTYIGPSLAAGAFFREQSYGNTHDWINGIALASLGINLKSYYPLHSSSSINHRLFISLFSFCKTQEQQLKGHYIKRWSFVNQVVWLSNRFEYRFRLFDSLSLALSYDFELLKYRYAYGAIAAMDWLSLAVNYHF